MNDRFKYRAWNKHQKKMFDVYQIDYCASLLYCEAKEGTCHTFGFIGCELLQCTGLKDKNGELIFEGDNVKDKYGVVYIVQFSCGAFMLRDGDVSYHISDLKSDIPCKLKLEIIGTIHDDN